MSYQIKFTKNALKDLQKLPSRLKQKLKIILLEQIVVEPYLGKKLIGDLLGFFRSGFHIMIGLFILWMKKRKLFISIEQKRIMENDAEDRVKII